MGKKKEKRHFTKKQQKKRRIIIGICCFLLLLGIGLCYYFFFYSGEKIDLKIKTPFEEKKKLTVVDENSTKRPIAVMIDNNIGNNKHAGLQEAYVSYEAIVEGGLTRIMALFKDKETALIGPVRSSRHYFLDYALENDALYAHFGWSTYAQKDISSLGVSNINGLYVDSAYWRDQKVAAPHNVFTSIDKLYDSAKSLNYEVTSSHWKNLNYTTDTVDLSKFERKDVTCKKSEEEAPCNKNPDLIEASTVTIPYSYSQERSYQYDPSNDRYLRFMNGVAHTDKGTGAQFHYKNIIIMKVSNHSLDNEGRQDLDTTGSGEGYYITGGYALPITWQKSSRSSKTIYTYQDGSKVKIKDGNTFIQVEPATQTPTFS